jgi:hypothetical protein
MAHEQSRSAVRGAVRASKDDSVALATARARVDAVKRSLDERGPVWWTDGSLDYNRHMAANTPYAAWFVSLGEEQA